MLKLKMSLRQHDHPRQVEVELEGSNVAEITGQLPETINQLLRHLSVATDGETTKIGVTYEL